MKTATHTPGPWRALGTVSKTQCVRTTDERYEVLVSGPYLTDPEREANAAIIAEAPALLAALRALVDAHDAEPKELTAAEWDAARTILARLEGN